MPKIPTDPHGVADGLVEVRFSDGERQGLLQIARLEEGDPGSPELIEQLELAATRFLAWLLPEPFGPSVSSSGDRRRSLLALAAKARKAREQLEALDSRSRTLLSRSANFAWQGVENEIARLTFLEVAADDAAEHAEKETPEGRPQNLVLVQLGVDIKYALAPLDIKITTYPDGDFSKVIGIMIGAAKRCAASSDILRDSGVEVKLPRPPSDLRNLIELVNTAVLQGGDTPE